MNQEKKGSSAQRKKIVDYLTRRGPTHIKDIREAAALGRLNNVRVKISKKNISQYLNHMVKVGILKQSQNKEFYSAL